MGKEAMKKLSKGRQKLIKSRANCGNGAGQW